MTGGGKEKGTDMKKTIILTGEEISTMQMALDTFQKQELPAIVESQYEEENNRINTIIKKLSFNLVAVPEKIYKISKNGLIKEYYFIGLPDFTGYGIYANQSGHFPKRVYLGWIGSNTHPKYFTSRDRATKTAIRLAKNALNILIKSDR